jgi:thioredoxin reductase (NADPH)
VTQDLYDILIVGGGPGGLTAGLYGARARLKTMILEKARPGGQAATTAEVENWSGTIKTTGPELMEKMAEHASILAARSSATRRWSCT